MPSAPPRVRFAPSPTGYLHIGGVRTALFNWLWARRKGGTFILRIEDTDRERSTPESVAVILDAMRWLGLDWDEGPEVGGPHGPYFQMERLDLYRAAAERLVREGKAYRCWCTREEIDAQRAALKARDPKASYRYPGTCRHRKDEPDRPFVVRFAAPAEGAVVYEDVVYGEIRTPNASQQDFVLLRPDGVPLYNFGAVVDDVEMGVTLVARGRDHLVNTPQQILVYEALGRPPPDFAHLPMMLAPSGEKLSKRHAAVGVGEYRALGYPPAAVLNYLVRFGWSCGDREIFSLGELVDAFGWDTVGRTDGRFDPQKFAAVAFEHLRRPELTPTPRYADMARPFLADLGIAGPDPIALEAAIPTVRERARTLREAADAVAFYFRDPEIDPAARAKFLVPDAAPRLEALAALVEGAPAWDAKAMEERVAAWLAERGLKMKDVAQPARVALTGRTVSPGLYEVMAVLGRERTLARLRRGAALAASGAPGA